MNSNTMISTDLPVGTVSMVRDRTPLSREEILAWTHERGENPGYPTLSRVPVAQDPESLEVMEECIAAWEAEAPGINEAENFRAGLYDFREVDFFVQKINLIAYAFVDWNHKPEAFKIIERLAEDSQRHRIMLETIKCAIQGYRQFLSRGTQAGNRASRRANRGSRKNGR